MQVGVLPEPSNGARPVEAPATTDDMRADGGDASSSDGAGVEGDDEAANVPSSDATSDEVQSNDAAAVVEEAAPRKNSPLEQAIAEAAKRGVATFTESPPRPGASALCIACAAPTLPLC